MKVLYVEDNPMDADLTKRTLAKTAPQIQVEVVPTQARAMKRLQGKAAAGYDLVLMDMRLPDGDGIAILSYIRGHSLPLAVVVITGGGDEETAVTVLKAGADDYVVKQPGYTEFLHTVMENALRRFRTAVKHQERPIHVLYVEHHEADIELTRRHLQSHAPYVRMDTVKNQAEMTERLHEANRQDPYDVLLLDYRLPGANALEIVKGMAVHPDSGIPIVLVTGQGDQEVAAEAIKLGASDYVVKNPGYLFKLPLVLEKAFYFARMEREHAELERREKELRKANTHLRTIFENSADGIGIVDAEGKFSLVNRSAARMYGYTTEQLLGMSAFELYPDAAALETMLKALRAEGAVKNYEIEMRTRDGKILPFALSITLLKADTGETTGSVAVSRDLSEKKRLEDQIQQAQKIEAIGTLAGGIAHDFNNILTSILGYGELMKEDLQNDTAAQQNLEQILQSGMRAKELISQILTFSRQTDAEMAPLRLDRVVKDALKLLRPSIPTTIKIQTNIDSVGTIRANAVQVHQVLVNLATNAYHAMREAGGELKIGVEDIDLDAASAKRFPDLTPGPYVRLSVSDTGCGIDKAVADRIFDPYFTTKEKEEGTGLGLSVVLGIVKRLGGAVTVYSEKNQGTVFHLYFPKILTDRLPADLQGVDPAVPTGTERILFVDDEPVLVKLGEKSLERLGYRVTGRSNSMEALELFRSKPDAFDLVITDLTMPHLSGDRLAAELMAIRPDIPVMLCTGFSERITEDHIDRLGIRAYLQKPVVLAEMAKVLRRVLDGGSH